MRLAYGERLLELEQNRSAGRRGHRARVWQLKCGTAACAVLYALLRYHLWRHPRPVAHVWVDQMLVEVIADSWTDSLSGALLWAGIVLGSLLTAVVFFGGRDRNDEVAARERKRTRHALSAGWPAESVTADITPLTDSCSTLPPAPRPLDATRVPQPRVDPSQPMRTSADLASFLEKASLRQERPRSPARDFFGPFAGDADNAAAASRAFPASASELHPLPRVGAVHVRYARRGVGGTASDGAATGDPPKGLSDADWRALGIAHADRALARVREWVSGRCRRLVDEVDECDRWFSAHGIEAYDCGHSLSEAMVTTASTTSLAMPATAVSLAQSTSTLKSAWLLELRRHIQQNDHRNFDIVLRLDQRLALEPRLDVTQTFQRRTTLSNAELFAQQQYTLRRLRALAKQRTLAAYHHSTGDDETWRDGYPCDALLLLHVVRTSVEGMSHCVRFGYQSSGTPTHDLALCVGDNGEPYFYVRYHSSTIDRVYTTHSGQQSLFEALLVLAAIVHVHHDDVYGGVGGSLDLKRAGLVGVVTEPAADAWTATF